MNKLIAALLLIAALNVWGHGDHHHGPRIPLAPHGGVLGKGVHQKTKAHGHGKSHHNHKQILFEVVTAGKEVRIYPIELNHDSFKELKPSEFKKSKIEIYNPRAEEKHNPKINEGKGFWVTSLEGIKGRRFFVLIEGKFQDEKYKAKIQIEMK